MGSYPYRRPRVFCASLADWLDDEVPTEWLADLLRLIHDTPALDWLLLTKRPQNFNSRLFQVWHDTPSIGADLYDWVKSWDRGCAPQNVWIGTTVEDSPRKERLEHLREIPAKVRFLSCEPLLADLGFMDLRNGIDWVIAGGESGPGCREFDPDWARELRDECKKTGTAFFMKQMGGVRKPFPAIPADLMIREFPKGGHS
jgi:protein gp37